jgi:hypothetical protein
VTIDSIIKVVYKCRFNTVNISNVDGVLCLKQIRHNL